MTLMTSNGNRTATGIQRRKARYSWGMLRLDEQANIHSAQPHNYLLSGLKTKKLVAGGNGLTFGLVLNWESLRSIACPASSLVPSGWLVPSGLVGQWRAPGFSSYLWEERGAGGTPRNLVGQLEYQWDELPSGFGLRMAVTLLDSIVQ